MYNIIKRFFDIFFVSLGILILFPFFVIIILILRFTSEGEVFYNQSRIGLNKNKFKIFKFATMQKNSILIGHKSHTVRNDPRITKVGKILRITKINELPQLFNVLNGTMSLVGPRPLIESSFNKYPDELKNIIYLNKPGITGLGSLIFRDEEKLVSIYNDLGGETLYYYRNYIFPFKAKVENWYYHNKTFFVDFIILFLTFYSILFKKNTFIFKIFKTIPTIPEMLTEKGIKNYSNEKK
ncbi:sugar transferase [Polaribacter sp.]|uniref:sugar transferase n=1 Tax=Polaribacter sp. TaxID=1920175 RepID=UPI00404853FB